MELNAKILVANPYSDNHINLIKEFEQKLNNNLPYQTSDILMDIRNKESQESYLANRYNRDNVEIRYCQTKRSHARWCNSHSTRRY